MKGYRIQMYVHDCGAYHKVYIQGGMSEAEYGDINAGPPNRRAVILPEGDPFGEKLPEVVRGRSGMEALVARADKLRWGG